MSMRVVITYSIEPLNTGGFLVWRRIGDAAPVALSIGTSRRARRFPARADAEAAIDAQCRADMAAGTRLGVTVVTVVSG